MARPIEYDRDSVLNSAMEVFWRQGYDSTSMKDLVKATGLSTRSMYNIFESKNGLFNASLNWYFETNVRKRYEKLIKDVGLHAIKNFMITTASSKRKNGCLYVNTVSERSCINSDSLSIVDQYFNDLEVAFKTKLIYAQKHEGYKGDPELRSKQLVVIIQGLSVHSKTTESLEENKCIVEDLLSLMGI